MIRVCVRGFALLGLMLLLAGCGKFFGNSAEDKKLAELIKANALDVPFEADLSATAGPLTDLGGLLFFSPDLSIDGSVSCASCHHPSKGGADGIALPIGIGGLDSRNIGEKRIEAAKNNPDIDVHAGLIPRNSPTVINAALYRQAMFWDGRVRYGAPDPATGKRSVEAGFGVAKFNPSNYQQGSLLQTQARMPLTSAFEMKGGLAPYKNNHEIEQSIVSFLRTNPKWCGEFAKVWSAISCEEAITLNHLTEALAGFQSTLLFTDSSFERYIRGKQTELTEQQKRGALLFLQTTAQGGAGCISCHSGKIFSSERFVNLNIPPSGQGANDNGLDFGRNNVDKSVPRFSFRVPSLLNIELTAPYFHNGVALTLEDAIRHHLTEPSVVRNSKQIKIEDYDYDGIAAMITEDYHKNNQATILVQPKNLSAEQIADIVSFLHALTDPCLKQEACIKKITKEIVETKREKVAETKESEHKKRVLDRSTVVAPKLECAKGTRKNDAGKLFFSRHGKNVGLTHERKVGLIRKGWLVDVVNYSGLSAMDVNNDCLDDLVFDGGVAGLFYYEQNKGGTFIEKKLPFHFVDGDVTPLVMDLDGDYRFDLWVGNLGQNPSWMAFDFMAKDDRVFLHRPAGPVINASPADIDQDGDLDITYALWRSFNTLPQEHVWMNDGAGNLAAKFNLLELRESATGLDLGGNEQVKRPRTSVAGAPDMTFTPNFADMDGDGDQDLLLAADFSRSQVLRNDHGNFVDITDKQVINDNNGMGAAVADFDNDGDLDWFVTSINDTRIPIIHGHKLYRNQGGGVFTNEQIGEISEWSWGACARDFDNDGWVDIFYISGYGEPMKTAVYETQEQQKSSERFLAQVAHFASSVPVLLLNDGKGGFIKRSVEAGLGNVLDGRAIGCFDAGQDGDIDIVVAPLEGAPVFFRNELGGENQWLAIRLIGLPGNTEAFGAKVTLLTSSGKQYREVMFENNYISRNPAQLHFGLGKQEKIDKVVIELPAPAKRKVELTGLAVNQLHVIRLADLLKESAVR
jgi:cytochrome c peroxidase